MPDDFDLEGDILPANTPETKSTRKGGKPKGWKKPVTAMSNGKFVEKDLYLFVPKETIAESDRERFISLCDAMILDLGADSMKEADLEEVALYYRDRIYSDRMYRSFAEADGITDANMIAQIEKLNKSLEQRKSNLGARFVDRGKQRKDNSSSSLVDLLNRFIDNPSQVMSEGVTKASEIESNRQKYTNTVEYMSERATRKSVTPVDQE